MTHDAAPQAVAGVLLAPGAGTDCNHPSLLAIDEGLHPLPVARFDFPYRRAGRKAPDRAPKLVAAVREEATALAHRLGVSTDRLVLGGRSMGGRMCSLAVAEGLPAAGLVLISYPLHPPGRPERLRVDHFDALDLPCLFVSGTRDPFGTPEEFRHHTEAIAGPVTLHFVDRARHELKGAEEEVVGAIATWLAQR